MNPEVRFSVYSLLLAVMSPVANKEDAGAREEVDEVFHSPSISRCGEEEETTDGVAAGGPTSTTNNNITHHNKDSSPPPPTQPTENGDKSNPEAKAASKKDTDKESEADKMARESAVEKSQTLATFIVSSLTSQGSGDTKDTTEATLLRCVRTMMARHDILLKGMMKRLDVTRETGYVSFVAVANELFEIDGEGKVIVTWGRIVAFYAFGARLAMYCQEKGMEDFCGTISGFLGQYAAEVVAPFVTNAGGWARLSEEFPAGDDLENKAWKFLAWTAIGLGLAATASFFTSH